MANPWTVISCLPHPGVFVAETGEQTHSRMRKGWLTSVSTSFSLWTCCSCFSRITSGIFICFRAKKALLFLSLTRKTRPNVPVPEVGEPGRREWGWKESTVHGKTHYEKLLISHFACINYLWVLKPGIYSTYKSNDQFSKHSIKNLTTHSSD